MSAENLRVELASSADPQQAVRSAAFVSPIPWWKRSLDVTLSVLLLVGCAPLGVFIAALIKATSRGPIFFRQDRIGLYGRTFRIWKFRTMHVEADAGVHAAHVQRLLRSKAALHKIDTQYRLIPGGQLLRLLGLDELPQLFNVLAGEMSLIGPRPDVIAWDEYEPWQRARFNVLPGLTGLWQVSGKNRTTFQEMIELDLQYIRRRSWWLDLWILGMTFPAIFQQCWDVCRGDRTAGPAEASTDAEGVAT